MLISPGATAHPGNRRTACGFPVEDRRPPVFPTEGGLDRIRGLGAPRAEMILRVEEPGDDVVESPETYECQSSRAGRTAISFGTARNSV